MAAAHDDSTPSDPLLNKTYLSVYGARSFITLMITPSRLVNIMCQTNPLRSIPSHFLRLILIFTSHLALCFLSGLLTSSVLYPNHILFSFIFHIRWILLSVSFFLHYHPDAIWWTAQCMNPFLTMRPLPAPYYLIPLKPKAPYQDSNSATHLA